MAYMKGLLAGLAAVFGVLFAPTLIRFLFLTGGEKATGFAIVLNGFVEALMSPLFWIEVFSVFALFFVAGRLGNKALRVLLFWVPTIAITTLGCAIIWLLTFVFLRSRGLSATHR
jgi:hypothetical protein